MQIETRKRGNGMQIRLPYGDTQIEMEADAERVIESRVDRISADTDGVALVEAALRAPIGSRPLHELARGKKNAVIIISDHTRPVPSRVILPAMLRELREGSPEIDITLLVATGCHRCTKPEELRAKLGDAIFARERIVVHDAFDEERNVELGVLPSGARLVIDKLAAETELLVSEGFIEPHFFAGFSGGRKSVLPGICAKQTVYGNHCGSFIASPYARGGVLENNPIHRDMEQACVMARLQFIVNVVLDSKKNVAAAFAGDFQQAHAAGAAFLRRYCEVQPVMGDIVVTTNGGAPLDQNLYQCVKGLTAAESCARDGGTIILCAQMADGIGGEQFYRDMRDCESPEALFARFSDTPQAQTVADQWQTQILCRVLMRHRVIFVTRRQMEKPIREMKMEYAPDLPSALRMAGDGDVTVIPDGISVIFKRQEPEEDLPDEEKRQRDH